MDWVKENAVIIGIVAGVGLLLLALRAFLPKKKVIGEDMKLNLKCNKCSWQGTVTKYNQVCRKCGSRDMQSF